MIHLRLQQNGNVQIYDSTGSGELIALVFSTALDAYMIGYSIAEQRELELRVDTAALYHALRESGIVE